MFVQFKAYDRLEFLFKLRSKVALTIADCAPNAHSIVILLDHHCCVYSRRSQHARGLVVWKCGERRMRFVCTAQNEAFKRRASDVQASTGNAGKKRQRQTAEVCSTKRSKLSRQRLKTAQNAAIFLKRKSRDRAGQFATSLIISKRCGSPLSISSKISRVRAIKRLSKWPPAIEKAHARSPRRLPRAPGSSQSVSSSQPPRTTSVSISCANEKQNNKKKQLKRGANRNKTRRQSKPTCRLLQVCGHVTSRRIGFAN